MNLLIAESYPFYMAAHVILQGVVGQKRRTPPLKMYGEPLVHYILLLLGSMGVFAAVVVVYESNPTGYLWVRGIGALIILSGLLLSMWALNCLGNNWIGGIGIHKGHVLIQDGPYRVIRHPLYTGMMVGALGSGIVTLNPFYAVATLVFALAFAARAPREEQALRTKFKKYDAYTANTGWFFPKLRRA